MGGDSSRVAASQFPAFLQRTTDFAHWHMDAERRPGVAGISADRLFAAAGQRRLRQPVSGISGGAVRWYHRGSEQSETSGDRDPDGFHDSGGDFGLAHSERARAGM